MDEQLRRALRKFESGDDPSVDKLRAAYERAGDAVELIQVQERSKEVNIHIDTLAGEEDSLFGPWELDNTLLELAELRLREQFPNAQSFEDFDEDYYPITGESARRHCPQLSQILGHLLELTDFLAHWDNRINSIRLIMVINAALGTTWRNRISLVTDRINHLRKLFGEIAVLSIYVGGLVDEEDVNLTAQVRDNVIASSNLRFTGSVFLKKNLLNLVEVADLAGRIAPLQPSLLNTSIENILNYLHHILRNSPDTPGYFQTSRIPSCYYDVSPRRIDVGVGRHPIVRPCLGLGIRREHNPSPNLTFLNSTALMGLTDVPSPVELITFFWLLSPPHSDEEGEETYEVYLIERNSATRILDEDDDLPVMTTIQEFKAQIVRAAKNHDDNIVDIAWIY